MKRNSEESTFQKATKQPRPPDPGSSEGVEFEKWDWKKHDPEFFAAFSRLPESNDQSTINQAKWNRYMLAKKSGMPKPDYRPRNFMWVMRKEIAIICLSVGFGLFVLPKWQRSAARSAREAREPVQPIQSELQHIPPQLQNFHNQQGNPYQPSVYTNQQSQPQQSQAAFDWGPNKPRAHLSQSPYTNAKTHPIAATAGQYQPEVFIVNNNITNGYNENYNDDTDQRQRMDFAREVERLHQENQRRQDPRFRKGGLD